MSWTGSESQRREIKGTGCAKSGIPANASIPPADRDRSRMTVHSGKRRRHGKQKSRNYYVPRGIMIEYRRDTGPWITHVTREAVPFKHKRPQQGGSVFIEFSGYTIKAPWKFVREGNP